MKTEYLDCLVLPLCAYAQNGNNTMSKNICIEITTALISFDKKESSFLATKGETYKALVVKMESEGITFPDIQETMQTADGSDWVKNDDGSFKGSNKAIKEGSIYARSYERFASWFRLQYESDQDGIPLVESGDLVKKEKKSNGAGKRKESSGKIETLTGSEAVEVVLKDLFKQIDKDRTAKKSGAVKAAKALTDLATYLNIKL